jgi:hypothetical protein
VVLGTGIKNSTSPFLFMDIVKTTNGLTALPLEIGCNQTAMGLPTVTSAVFVIAKSF